jgi:hypothetical protein
MGKRYPFSEFIPLDRHDIPGLREKGLDFRLRDPVREVGHINFSVHVSSFEIPDWVKQSMHSSFSSSGGKTAVGSGLDRQWFPSWTAESAKLHRYPNA